MKLSEKLNENRDSFIWILPPPYIQEQGLRVNLGKSNTALRDIDVQDMRSLGTYLENEISSGGRSFAYGGYGENRDFYRRSKIFLGDKPRTIHLGVDFWVPEETALFMPLGGSVHSFADNSGRGNYGPSIITRHSLEKTTFHLLWGHLSRESIDHITEDQVFEAGETIGYTGSYEENGYWPPHLHFQIIIDIGDNKGDYPGVASPEDAARMLENCPNPELLFKLS